MNKIFLSCFLCFFVFSCERENSSSSKGSLKQLKIEFVESSIHESGRRIAIFDVRNQGDGSVVVPVFDYGDGDVFYNGPDFRYRLSDQDIWIDPNWSYSGLINPVVLLERESLRVSVDVTDWLELAPATGNNIEFIIFLGDASSNVFTLEEDE